MAPKRSISGQADFVSRRPPSCFANGSRILLLCFNTLCLFFLGACTSTPTTLHRASSSVPASSASTRITRATKAFTRQNPGQSGAHLLSRGNQALEARLALADMADRTLDAQYYIWHDDLSGSRMVEKLLLAADRGVRVRVLLDDIGVSASDESLLALDDHPNVEVRLFNPVSLRSAQFLGVLLNFNRANRRMHNKALIADDAAVIVGGRNIGDEYFDANEDMNFADLDVLAVGSVVPEVAAQFELYWNSPYAVGIANLSHHRSATSFSTRRQAFEAKLASTRRNHPQGAKPADTILPGFVEGRGRFHPCKAWALYDDPDKIATSPENRSTHLAPMLWSTVEGTTRHLFIVSPYFIPGKDGVKMLSGLRERGVRVTVLTNALASTDVAAVHAGYKRYRKPLLQAGVELYELKPNPGSPPHTRPRHAYGSSTASLHAKTFSFDDRSLFIGSMNLDPRSIRLNTEIGILLDSPELTSRLTHPVLQNLDRHAYQVQLDGRTLVWLTTEAGREVRYHTEPGTSAWQRLKVALLGLLPIEGQL